MSVRIEMLDKFENSPTGQAHFWIKVQKTFIPSTTNAPTKFETLSGILG